MKYLQVLIIGILVIATFLAVNKIQSSEQKLQIKEIQLKDTHAELQNLNSDYTELLKSDEDNTKELERLREKKKELERELQAKRKREAEERRLALVERAEASQPDPTPTPQANSHPVGCENYRSLVSQYSWNVDVAMQVVFHESGCNPSAVNMNDNHGQCVGSHGLFQLACLHSHRGDIYSPASNIAIAYQLWKEQGWGIWGVCTNGSVHCY